MNSIKEDEKCKYIRDQVQIYLCIPDISTKNNREKFVYPRSVYYSLCRHTTTASLETIGALINRDHATVSHHSTKFYKHCGQPFFEKYQNAFNYLLPIITEYFDLIDSDFYPDKLFADIQILQSDHRERMQTTIRTAKKVIRKKDNEIERLQNQINNILGIKVNKPYTMKTFYEN